MNATECKKFIQSFADHYTQPDLKSPYEVEFDGYTLYFRFNDHPTVANINKWAIDWAKYFIETEMPPAVSRYVEAYSADGEDDWVEVAVDFMFDSLNESAEDHVIKSGTVKVMTPFKTDYFDDDEGTVVVTVKPSTYEYRVLNINGWKSRQLKIDGEWVDVMDQCKDLEDILMAENKNLENEETTVVNIAPTVDYIGHVKPVVFPGLDDNDTPDIYDDPEGEKRKDAEDAAGDAAWISPIGKLVAGESVRKVVGGMVGLND